jgi:hypothetical protein
MKSEEREREEYIRTVKKLLRDDEAIKQIFMDYFHDKLIDLGNLKGRFNQEMDLKSELPWGCPWMWGFGSIEALKGETVREMAENLAVDCEDDILEELDNRDKQTHAYEGWMEV